jgi:hypothetical protein
MFDTGQEGIDYAVSASGLGRGLTQEERDRLSKALRAASAEVLDDFLASLKSEAPPLPGDREWSIGDAFDDLPAIPADPDGSYPMPERLAGFRVQAMNQPGGDEAWRVRVLRGQAAIMELSMAARARLHWGARDPRDVIIGPVSSPVRLVVEGASVPVEVKARSL